ncbi:MAG: hypothetical protein IJB31_04820 [Akkermansia sp.]|nr:hypothetical protein [Akkermansia sp.]
MMNLRHSLLLTTLAFGAGLGFTLWQQNKFPGVEAPQPATQEAPQQEPPAQIKQEIRSDEFTLRLLQAAMQCQEGNILLAPHALAENLGILQELSQGDTKAELETLHLPTERQTAAEEAGAVAFLFSENTLNYCDDTPADSTIPVPMEGHAGEPLVLLNSLLADATGEENAHFINGDHLAEGTRIISFSALHLAPTWQLPLQSFKTPNADFYNADGSMPRIRMLQCSGTIRRAQAADGSWQAVALFMKLSPQSPEDECLLLILPNNNSARRFAEQWDVAQINAIRKALAEAEPTPLCVEFPRLVFSPPTQDLSPLLQTLGLKKLLTPEADLSKLATDTPLYLNAALLKCRIPITENTVNEPGGIPDIRFDKPFIWCIGSLSTPAPPYALGIVENL